MAKKLFQTGVTSKKAAGEKITMLTAYDYPTAALASRAGIDMLLVGDSGGMTVLGYNSTVPVTMDDMILFSKAVSRGAADVPVVADLPFGAYEAERAEAVRNAVRLVKEGGADAVKLEGGTEQSGVISSIIRAGIPVMAHIGLLPQTAAISGGYRVFGKDETSAAELLDTALSLEELGVFSIVLECVTAQTAGVIAKKLDIPVIGIGSGALCDGQVLVIHDMLGYNVGHTPRFVKRYANLAQETENAIKDYIGEVKAGVFPAREHSWFMEEDEAQKLY